MPASMWNLFSKVNTCACHTLLSVLQTQGHWVRVRHKVRSYPQTGNGEEKEKCSLNVGSCFLGFLLRSVELDLTSHSSVKTCSPEIRTFLMSKTSGRYLRPEADFQLDSSVLFSIFVTLKEKLKDEAKNVEAFHKL